MGVSRVGQEGANAPSWIFQVDMGMLSFCPIFCWIRCCGDVLSILPVALTVCLSA